MKTNLSMLKDSIERSREQGMMTVKSGALDCEDYVVIRNDKAYVVKVENREVISCDCPHCEKRKQICKHMIKVSEKWNLNIRALNILNKV